MLSTNPSPSHMAMAAATSRLEVPGGQATGNVYSVLQLCYGRDRDATIRSQNELAQLQLAAAALHKHVDSLDSLAAWAAPVQLRLTAVEWWKDELCPAQVVLVRTGVDVLRILGRADRRICYWRYDFVRWKQLSQYVRSQNHVCIVWRSYG